VCTPLTVRRDVRSAAPLPSQVWPWTSRRPSPSASRAQACPPGPTGACAGWRPRSRRHSSVDSRALPGGTWSARRRCHVRVSAWSQPQKRGAPVSRDRRLMRGGRSWAAVPCPGRLWAPRRGGAAGSRGGGRCCPSVLIQRLRLDGWASPHGQGSRRVQGGLEALPQGLPRLACQAPCACPACGRRALGAPAPPHHPGGRSWPRLFDDRPRQPRVVASAGPPARGRARPVCPAQAPVGAAAAGAEEPARRQVALQPDAAAAIIQEVADRNVHHTPTLPHSARWLHMSRRGNI
jgi:hypothetical protein